MQHRVCVAIARAHVVNFPSELCRRRSGAFAEVARLVPPDGRGAGTSLAIRARGPDDRGVSKASSFMPEERRPGPTAPAQTGERGRCS